MFHRISAFVLATFTLCACAASLEPASSAVSSGPPLLDEWEWNMRKWGRHWGEYLSRRDLKDAERLNAVYYDAARVFYQIADYTGEDDPWIDYAEKAESIYLENYARPNQFRTSGYWRFPHGLYQRWRRAPNDENKHFLRAIRDKPAYSDIEIRDEKQWHRVRFSREIAYAINSHITALRAGLDGKAEALDQYIDAALAHLEIWRTGDFLHNQDKWQLRQPFMFGLTGEALISYAEYRSEQGKETPRIPRALAATADWFWDNMWVPNIDGRGHGAFHYLDRNLEGVGRREPAPDLNLLIAPVYAWLYKETGDPAYRQQADAIFAGGVSLACLECAAKIFHQNYRISFDYLKWRRGSEQRRSKGLPDKPRDAGD